MKKLTAIFSVIVFILALSACEETKETGEPIGTNSYRSGSDTIIAASEPPQSEDTEAVSGTVFHVGADKAYALTAEEIEQIAAIIETGNWNSEGTSDCVNDCKLIINGETYYYHSECGTWNDKLHDRCLSVTNAEKEKINAVLSQYVTLGLA